LQNATAAFAKVKQLEGGKGKYTNQLQSLADEAKDKTVILVSHRESTPSICNEVFKI